VVAVQRSTPQHKLFARLCLKLAEAKGKQKRSNTHMHMHSSGRNSGMDSSGESMRCGDTWHS